MSTFVNVHTVKNFNTGGWVVKKSQNLVNLSSFVNSPKAYKREEIYIRQNFLVVDCLYGLVYLVQGPHGQFFGRQGCHIGNMSHSGVRPTTALSLY